MGKELKDLGIITLRRPLIFISFIYIGFFLLCILIRGDVFEVSLNKEGGIFDFYPAAEQEGNILGGDAKTDTKYQCPD